MCGFVSVFLGGCQSKNVTYAMCVKIETWIYHIYRGDDHEKRVEVSSASGIHSIEERDHVCVCARDR